MASLTRDRNQIPGPLQVEYYTQRAGAGFILTEGTLIEPQGSEWSDARQYILVFFFNIYFSFLAGIYSDEQVAGWKKTVDSVHAHPLLQNG
jgi:2,4-dienoyl-CoA reductase-like NADH-dependent reductase (Old Yellow Enzyme family)